MRTVVPSREVYHLWANRAQPTARNSRGSVSFDGDTAYSYRAAIARLVEHGGRRAVLFGERRYSVTTSGHQSRCRSAIPPDVPVFTVPQLETTSHAHRNNLAYYAAEAARLDGEAKRARSHKDWKTERHVALLAEANAYCRFFGLADVFAPELVADLTKKAARAAKRAERERVKRQAVQDAKLRAELATAVANWQNGEVNIVPWNYPDTLLRVDPADVATVETSRGARVPLTHARRLYDKLTRGTLEPGDRAGPYTVAEVTADAVLIGCHTITRAEVERFAAVMGWTASNEREVEPVA